MKTILLAALFAVSCADAGEDVVTVGDVLIVVEPSPTHGPEVTCELIDATSCRCAMSECTEAALLEAGRKCNLLRGYGPKIVVE